MQGFGVHTFRLVNAAGDVGFVKFHWKPLLARTRCVGRGGQDLGRRPDFHRRDLWERIEAGEFPEWELGVQIFTEEQAEAFSFDTWTRPSSFPKSWCPCARGPHGAQPQPGQLLCRNRAGGLLHRARVPGIDFSNDPLLAGRIHSYVDTQISRLGGPNFHEIPINAPLAPVHNNQRDGMHRQAIPRGRVSYEPNSLGGGCPFQAGAAAGLCVVARASAQAGAGQGARQARKVCRPLHPGHAVLRQPDAVEQAHIARRSASS
jgi:catalase